MNKINTIYTTVSYSKTHIAADDKYIGSVDSYNNCLTQFFAWIFRQSVSINFDGKIHSVNKESYRNLLLSLRKENELIGASHFFRDIAEKCKLPEGNVKMRDVISKGDRIILFYKLAYAISRGNTEKALLMIGKGAALDMAYFDRAGIGPSFGNDTDNLSKERRYKFHVVHGTPILQASYKANQIVVDRLKKFGASLNATGQTYMFERVITDVNRRFDVTLAPVVHHHHHGRHRHAHVNYHPRIHERTIIHTEDTRSEKVDYRLNI